MRHILIFIIFIPYLAISQKINGRVIDATDGKSIPYVSIVDTKLQKGTYSDSIGNFSFTTNESKDISIHFSCGGYIAKTISSFDLTNSNIVPLVPDIKMLEEVKIKAAKLSYRKKSLGYYKKIRGLYTYDFIPNTALRMAVFLQLQNHENSFLSTLNYRLVPKKSEKAISYRVRMRVMSNKNNLPYQDLIKEDLITDVDANQSYLIFNIERFGLEIPQNGFWIGLDVIGYKDKNNKFNVINTFEYGTAKGSISPCIGMEKGNPNESLQSAWGSKWFSWKDNFNTFMFGVDYLIPK
jgi:CarboxypepD_reg-like domain